MQLSASSRTPPLSTPQAARACRGMMTPRELPMARTTSFMRPCYNGYNSVQALQLPRAGRSPAFGGAPSAQRSEHDGRYGVAR
jgi:hypothetical protein